MSKQKFILTHPLMGNYGGLLQAYAMYTVLERLGYQSYMYRYTPKNMDYKPWNYLWFLLSLIRYSLRLSRNANGILRKIHISYKLFKDLRFHHENEYGKLEQNDSFVVGSDQVWRAIFCRMMKTPEFYFLDFASPAQRSKSIAYAASFGTDEWEGTPEETKMCGQMLREFKAVSVREHSGVSICQNVFGVKAVQMPDPTMLLTKDDYQGIIDKEKTWCPVTPWLSAYILDADEVNSNLSKDLANALNLQHQHLMGHADAPLGRGRHAPTVSQWLRLIRDCDYMITDSFHGSVFAIIFNKPFVCLGNTYRGADRFLSLFNTFGLTARLITEPSLEKILETLHTPIDWERVNTILASEQKRGYDFLTSNL